jgi:hypothetical protein
MDYSDRLHAVMCELTDIILKHRAEELSAAPATADAVVSEVMRAVGNGTAQGVFGELASRAIAHAKSEGFRVERNLRITFTTLLNDVTVPSPYLRRPGQTKGLRPVNDAFRVRAGGRTVALERVMTDFGIDQSYEQAVSKLQEHYGIALHRTAMRRTCLKHGALLDRQESLEALDGRYAILAKGPPGPPLLVEMDGSAVRTGTLSAHPEGGLTKARELPRRRRKTEWRDLRLGFVGELAKKKRHYVGGITSFTDVADQLRGAALNYGLTATTFVLRLTDGGIGLKECLDDTFDVGQHVLDWPHLVHHLAETAATRRVEESEVVPLYRGWLAQISRGRVDDVIAAMNAHDKSAENERSVQLAAYLTRFRNSVNYDEFRSRGLPIGSGEIESANRSQVQARLKLPGTWWTVNGANWMLKLRLRRTNGWDDYWRAAAA